MHVLQGLYIAAVIAYTETTLVTLSTYYKAYIYIAAVIAYTETLTLALTLSQQFRLACDLF